MRLLIDPFEMWRLDTIGIADQPDDSHIEQHPALVQFRTAVYKEKDRYVVPLMLKTSGAMWSTNHTAAETRLKCQLQRFEQQPELLRQYDSAISEYFKEGHAERVEPSETPGEIVHYLLHHAVVRREAKTTKVRIVFDTSSHEQDEPSLNDMLDKGVKIGYELLQLLLQFRCSP